MYAVSAHCFQSVKIEVDFDKFSGNRQAAIFHRQKCRIAPASFSETQRWSLLQFSTLLRSVLLLVTF